MLAAHVHVHVDGLRAPDHVQASKKNWCVLELYLSPVHRSGGAQALNPAI